MQGLDDYRALAARHLAIDPDDRMARAMVELVAEVARLRAALAHYRHCPHAIPDCYCCEVARFALGDIG